MTQSTFASQPKNVLMWFRRDLRLSDNTALGLLFDEVKQSLTLGSTSEDSNTAPTITALYAITPKQWLEHDMSLVQMDFLFRTLTQLAKDLSVQLNIRLDCVVCDTFDDSVQLIAEYCQSHYITHVFANIEYEFNEQQRDQAVTAILEPLGIDFNLYHDQCILPPGTVKTLDDTLYKVFTPFYKKWQNILAASPIQVYDIPEPLYQKETRINKTKREPSSDNNKQLDNTLNQINDHHQHALQLFRQHYQYSQEAMDALLAHAHDNFPAGETAAKRRLDTFIIEDIADYLNTRDQPALMATSRLSAYLTMGAISARTCYDATHRLLMQTDNDTSETAIERWISELAWRDFYRHILHSRPDVVKGAAYKKQTDLNLSWSYDENDFKLWSEGLTGVPLVDAAMRCLNQTGFMHNRLRMVTAMFLTKDLLMDWRLGERYFMQTLIDGDFASNNGGWQWSASVGTDASPYFRIMNPFSQAKSHDTDALFIKTWLPELKDVPPNVLHNEQRLSAALSKGGAFETVDYPVPMVEHRQARLYAIDQFKTAKQSPTTDNETKEN